MIEVVNLKKVYKAKKGVEVVALDGVSLKFATSGMVFIVGKSGCGKSTLLNLLGGLDTFDSGDIIVNNTSTKEFKQRHFDSYRNTYVGFVFQEYNIIDNLSVGKNIELAVNLQGKKTIKSEVENALSLVELDGFYDRHINELSGGQKQRVAIARALIKQPEILLCDEPSGALDSVSAEQVFSTLKKLSKDKLVIVVSHDLDFANRYGDRIIEMADGKIIGDTLNNEVNNDNSSQSFKLIKSKLPVKSAMKTGVSGLKLKPLKLIFTIILSIFAFALLGSYISIATYNKNAVEVNTIYNNKVQYMAFTKKIQHPNNAEKYSMPQSLNDEDLNYLKENLNADFLGVYNSKNGELSLKNNCVFSDEAYSTQIYSKDFNGFIEISESNFKDYGIELLENSKMPANDNEILISSYMCKAFLLFDYAESIDGILSNGVQKINNETELIGKKLIFENKLDNEKREYLIVGIFDTNDNFSGVINAANESAIFQSATLRVTTEFEYLTKYSLNTSIIVNNGYISRDINKYKNEIYCDPSLNQYTEIGVYNGIQKCNLGLNIIAKLSSEKYSSAVVWKNLRTGEIEKLQSLNENQIVLPESIYNMFKNTGKIDNVKLEFELPFAFNSYRKENVIYQNLEVVGYIPFSYGYQTAVLSDALFNVYGQYKNSSYAFAIGNMPKSKTEIKKILKFSNENQGVSDYECVNYVSYLANYAETFGDSFRGVLMGAGLALAIFSSVLFGNFIAVNISDKRKEIGVLRAIGARSSDVFKIFYAESVFLASIIFVLSIITSLFAINYINSQVRLIGLSITLFSFGFLQILLLALTIFAVATIASLLPILKIANEKPVDAIRRK